MKIEDKLLKLRKEKGLSQEEVADRLNVSRQTISKWETGQSSPDFDKIIPLCELYEISSDELLTGKKKEEIIKEEKEHENMKAKGIGLSLGTYVLSILCYVFLMISSDPIIALGVFFLGIILATALFIYTCVMYKGKNDMKFLKKLIKKIDSTGILVILSSFNLIFDLLSITNDLNGDYYYDEMWALRKIFYNDIIQGFIFVSGVLILVFGVRYIINAVKSKKDILLKVSFASFAILTSFNVVSCLSILTFEFFRSFFFN